MDCCQSLVDYYEDRTLQSLDTAITSTKTEVKAVKDATETNAAKLDGIRLTKKSTKTKYIDFFL